MRIIISCVLLLILVLSCKKEDVKLPYFQSELPGKHLNEMAIDQKNYLYFVTHEPDLSVEVPLFSSSGPPNIFYLSRKQNEQDMVEVLDNDFLPSKFLLFDNNNTLWSTNGNKVYCIENGVYEEITALPEGQGGFDFMAYDHENNIWLGGITTGLYKIDSQKNVSIFNISNSPLPTNTLTSIFIDKNNTKWITMRNDRGVLEIKGEDWIFHNSSNSNITSQDIWCITGDKEGNIWIGCGFENPSQSLMKYDGSSWTTVIPEDSNGNKIYGEIREIFSDSTRIYIVSQKIVNMAFSSNILLTFNGTSWNKISEVPEDDPIKDIVVDYYRNSTWIRTLNEGIYKISL